LEGFADRAANPLGSVGVLLADLAIDGFDDRHREKHQDGLAVGLGHSAAGLRFAGRFVARHKLDIY
jgi:hypothetical protein